MTSPGARLARALAAVLALAAAGAHAQDGAPDAGARPNVVLVIGDDLGRGDVAPWSDGRIRTPTFARLARQGAVFERAYSAAPVCAPSRCAILTGLHAGHCSVRRNRQPNVALGLSDPTLADTLLAAGYRTAFVGKWGLGGEASPGVPFARWSAPGHVGFLRTSAFLDDEGAVSAFPPGVWREGAFVPVAANADGARGTWIADVVADETLATLDALLSEPAPFLLVVASTLPHRELFAPDLGPYAAEPWPEIERTYAAMVSRLDDDLGRILARLEAAGALEHTLVVVASDHGPHDSDGHLVSFFGSTAGLRGQKRDLYEGGVRVPLLVLGPGVPAGASLDAPVSLVDLLPTLAALAGAPAPDALDGVSFEPLLRGSGADAPAPPDDVPAPRALFLGAAEAGGGSEPPTRYALLEWPLVLVEREDGVSELYDLASDPTQAVDLAGARSGDVERLRARRIAESEGSLARTDPVLAVRGEGTALAPPRAREAVVVLDLELTAAPVEPGGPLLSRVATPPLRALLVGATPDAPGVVLERTRADHLVVPAHPALSFGDESFAVEARVALRSRASALEAAERQWLAVVKPTGTPDGALDWGVLAQAADVGAEGTPDASPGALALVFGRGRLRDDDTWAVRSHLSIDDDAEHAIAVRFDAEHDRVIFEVDGAREEIALAEDLGHVRSDGPLVLGAHHDARGVFDGGLDGRIAAFRLLRGAGAAPSEAAPRELVVDVGTLRAGGADVVRTFTIASDATAPSRAMTLALEPAARGDEGSAAGEAPRDARVTATLSRTTVIGSTDPGATLTLVVSPRHPGELDQAWILRGTALRLGHDAVGSPVHVRVRGLVHPAMAEPSGGSSAGWLEAAAVVALVALVVWIARRRGPARPA